MALVRLPRAQELVTGGIHIHTVPVPHIVCKHTCIPRPVRIRVRVVSVYAALLEAPVQLRATGKENTCLTLEEVVDKGSLESVAVAIHHGAPPIHLVLDPIAYEALVNAAHVVYNSRPVFPVLLLLSVIRIATDTADNAGAYTDPQICGR